MCQSVSIHVKVSRILHVKIPINIEIVALQGWLKNCYPKIKTSCQILAIRLIIGLQARQEKKDDIKHILAIIANITIQSNKSRGEGGGG